MNVTEQFLQYWRQRFMHLPAGHPVVLAISGGIDSVVLADLLSQSSIAFVLAHCNFGLRGAESDRDEAFVKTLAGKYRCPVLVKRFDTAAYAQEHKMAIQEAARVLRYTWFEELINNKSQEAGEGKGALRQPVAIATAHHANDNIETLLMNFFRGTGISGLHGIQPVQGKIIRPLLFARREAIAAYAQEHGLEWVEDSSNASEKYTRNFFRLQLIPSLQKIFPQVEDNLLHNLDRFNEVEQLYRQAVDTQLKKLPEVKGNEVHIPIYKLLKAVPFHTLLWEIIHPFHFTAAQVDEVKKLIDTGHNGSYLSSSTHRIIKNRNWLVIAPLQTETAQHIAIAGEGIVVFHTGSLELTVSNVSDVDVQQSTTAVALLDMDRITFPLLLRPWKQGDYFYPLGMKKKKKVSRLLIDLKLSATDKEKVWVVEMDKKIIWIVGRRIDERFKILPHTQKVLQLRYKPGV